MTIKQALIWGRCEFIRMYFWATVRINPHLRNSLMPVEVSND